MPLAAALANNLLPPIPPANPRGQAGATGWVAIGRSLRTGKATGQSGATGTTTSYNTFVLNGRGQTGAGGTARAYRTVVTSATGQSGSDGRTLVTAVHPINGAGTTGADGTGVAFSHRTVQLVAVSGASGYSTVQLVRIDVGRHTAGASGYASPFIVRTADVYGSGGATGRAAVFHSIIVPDCSTFAEPGGLMESLLALVSELVLTLLGLLIGGGEGGPVPGCSLNAIGGAGGFASTSIIRRTYPTGSAGATSGNSAALANRVIIPAASSGATPTITVRKLVVVPDCGSAGGYSTVYSDLYNAYVQVPTTGCTLNGMAGGTSVVMVSQFFPLEHEFRRCPFEVPDHLHRCATEPGDIRRKEAGVGASCRIGAIEPDNLRRCDVVGTGTRRC